MKPDSTSTLFLLAGTFLAIAALPGASAHVSYANRDFGTFQATGNEAPVTLANQTVSSTFGWADAADADFGDSHRLRAFRFTLANPATVTLQVQAAAGLLPAFSVYGGLCHVAPAKLDHDATAASLAYLAGLNAGPKEGSLYALGDWAIGNDDGLLSFLAYAGHAADGTATNYGTAPGINGDGVADGFVAGTFALAAGTYSVFIGGANYDAQNVELPPTFPTYAITPTLTVVPEPASVTWLALAGGGMLVGRLWKRGRRERRGCLPVATRLRPAARR